MPGQRPINTTDLADKIAAEAGLTKVDAKKNVDGVFTAIGAAAAAGNEVSLPGFGKFEAKDSAARKGRNPSTDEAIQIAVSSKLASSPPRPPGRS
ncbi:HU family DNA-binding protein [Rhizorhabdus argentea]|uniref:HU family DNA-binding protein n=1 Tax=Rhizorhabdus argentea TaxID=1387174 RepID=UPI003BF47BBB